MTCSDAATWHGSGAAPPVASCLVHPSPNGAPLMSLLSPLPGRLRRAAAGALVAGALAGAAAVPAHAVQKVTPDVSGRQDVLVVGCRFADTTSPDILDY